MRDDDAVRSVIESTHRASLGQRPGRTRTLPRVQANGAPVLGEEQQAGEAGDRRTSLHRVGLLSALAIGCGMSVETDAIRASGHIEATEIRLAAKVGGRLLEAPLEEGDTVIAGELVARLETIDAEHQLAQARANVEAADAQLRLLLAGSRAEDLRRAEDQMAQAQAELDAARRDLDRLSGLADRGSATEKSRDDAATRKEIAERAVAAARAQLDKLVAGPRRQEIEAGLVPLPGV